MRPNHALAIARAAQQKDYTTVDVAFSIERFKFFTYKVLKKWKIQAGDHLVVQVPSGKLQVVLVDTVHKQAQIDETASFDYKWAVCKVSLTEYQSLLAQDVAFLQSVAEQQRKDDLAKAKLFLRNQR